MNSEVAARRKQAEEDALCAGLVRLLQRIKAATRGESPI